ncbi:SDR family oxidoreductase [Haliangium sp.]|uniref:SDR family oxidoreductase n=1 Tax=Haliangium sp. TaxID=2663208 RepID=UPI003D0F7745
MATVLITGSNRGIGLELCRQLAARGERVIAACRTPTPALEGLGVELQRDVDVSSAESVAALDQRLGNTAIDVLINNAGIMTRESLDDLDVGRILREFEVNSLGPLLVAATLRHRFGPGAKLAFITSRMGSIADNTSGGAYGYRMSKAALNCAAVSLARDLAPRQIAVAVLHPGWVRTDMTGGSGQLDPAESARGLIARIDELTLDTSGGFWHTNGDRLPW